MNYYTQKRDAINFIEELFKEGLPTNIILYRVSKRYGFGKKFVLDQIKFLTEIWGVEIEKSKQTQENPPEVKAAEEEFDKLTSEIGVKTKEEKGE